jgi:hypothetical protein
MRHKSLIWGWNWGIIADSEEYPQCNFEDILQLIKVRIRTFLNYFQLWRESEQCDRGDGLEDVQHLFTGCVSTQVAWAWYRQKIMHLKPYSRAYTSDFELINLGYVSPMDDEICWLVTQYCWVLHFVSMNTSTDELDRSLKTCFRCFQLTQTKPPNMAQI